MRLFLSLCVVVTVLITLASQASADTLHLKNGRSIDGIISGEDNETVTLEVSGGTVTFQRSDIESVSRSTEFDQDALRQEWERRKQTTEKNISAQTREYDQRPREIEFSQESNTIILPAKLNDSFEVSLTLDTGATLVVLRKSAGEKLGVNLENAQPDINMTLADGRKIGAKRVILNSVKVENVEAEHVEAAIMLEDIGEAGFGDGLLGMSFLKNFNFKIDYREKKLILEKL